MKSISLKFKLISLITALVLAFGILPPSTVAAASTSLTLDEFTSVLATSDSSKLVGIYVENLMAVRVVQQPNASYVSSISGTVTQFGLANQYGSIGLLAHNYLSGSFFSELQSGDKIMLVYGDGSSKEYSVSAIKQYQALSPNDPYSKFIDLEEPETTLSSTELFKTTYTTKGNLVLQTCISKDGNVSWGRLFVIATPAG
jgi:hypothetical protein